MIGFEKSTHLLLTSLDLPLGRARGHETHPLRNGMLILL